jgi:hypothetical protein
MDDREPLAKPFDGGFHRGLRLSYPLWTGSPVKGFFVF